MTGCQSHFLASEKHTTKQRSMSQTSKEKELRMRNIYVVPDFVGTEQGTQSNPFVARNSLEFDVLMRAHYGEDDITWHLNDGVFTTAGTKEWDDTNVVQHNRGFRMGRNWRFTSETGAWLAWDYAAVEDEDVSDVPIWLMLSTEARFDHARVNQHTPEDVWNMLPRGQSVSNLNIDLQYSAAVDRWKSFGKKLRVGAGLLGGHQASYKNLLVVNWGALGCESFPLYIQGSVGKYDRDLIAKLDPAKYVFDANLPDDECSHIVGCVFKGFANADTDDQVSLMFIAGGTGERTPGEWVQHMRAFAYQRGNTAAGTGMNRVQGHTIYQSLRGDVSDNVTGGCSVGYYGDFYSTRGVHIHDNTFLDCRFHGVQLQLSPTGPGADQYSHEGYVIGKNRITSHGPNVLLDTVGPPTATRFIRNIKVEADLTLENRGAENVILTGGGVPLADLKKRKGCRPW